MDQSSFACQYYGIRSDKGVTVARKQPTGYKVRRPLTLWGTARAIGDVIAIADVQSVARAEALVRSGRLDHVYAETDAGTVMRTRTKKVSERIAP